VGIAKRLLEYLKAEKKSRLDVVLDEKDWTFKGTQRQDTLQQEKGFDCGGFTCMAADYIAAGEPLQYHQQELPFFR
jgi:Ulp1 family protease